MADYANVLALAAQEVNQLFYRNDIMVENFYADNNAEFLAKIRANGTTTTPAPGGRGYTWYVNKINRSSGVQGRPNDGSIAGMTASGASGTQLVMSYTELLLRAQVSGQEYRTSGEGGYTEEQVKQFITMYREIVDGMERSQAHSIPFFLMGDGLCRYADYEGGSATINAGAEGTVAVSELKGFLPGDQVTKYTALGVSEGTFRVLDNGSAFGAGNIVIKNETAGNLSITSGGYFAVPEVGNTLLHGMEYIIDDGATNDAAYNRYPREASGSPNVGIDRTSAAGARSVRARVIDAGGQFGYATMDRAISELSKIGANKNVRLPDNGSIVPRYQYEWFIGPLEMLAIQQENRATGRAFTLEVNGSEDNGLRRATYSDMPINVYRCLPAGIAYLPKLDEFETSYQAPQIMSRGSFGIFDRITGTDNLEHYRVSRLHLLGKNLSACVKVTNTQSAA